MDHSVYVSAVQQVKWMTENDWTAT